MASLAQAAGSPLPLDLLDIANPHLWRAHDQILPNFAKLRAAGPLHYCPDSIYGPYWNVVSHKHIMEIEGRPDIFSSSWELGGITLVDRRNEPDFVPNFEADPLPMFIAMDRPEHTAQRRTVAPAFTPAEMLRQAGDIRGRTAELLDSLPVGESFDWVDKVSIELTTGMLALLFDFPWEDRRLLTKWSDATVDFEAMEEVEGQQARWEVLQEMAGYFTRLWQERASKAPGPDLISMMIHSDATKDMTPQTFMGNLMLLIVGGNDTTRNSMSGAVMVQNLYRDNWNRMMQNPDLIPNGVSELLRWQTPLAHMRRTANQDVEVAGQQIRKHDKLGLWYLSANRDENLFPDADVFDPTRENARRHIAFGFGIHRCVGARLAELQLNILFEELRARNMRVELQAPPEYIYSSFVNGYKQMQVKLYRD